MSRQTAGVDRFALPTSTLSAPYALIRAGRPRPGLRPRTQLALLVGAITGRSNVHAWIGYGLHADFTAADRKPRWIGAPDVVATFCVQPSRKAIDRARKGLRAIDAGEVRS